MFKYFRCRQPPWNIWRRLFLYETIFKSTSGELFLYRITARLSASSTSALTTSSPFILSWGRRGWEVMQLWWPFSASHSTLGVSRGVKSLSASSSCPSTHAAPFRTFIILLFPQRVTSLTATPSLWDDTVFWHVSARRRV